MSLIPGDLCTDLDLLALDSSVLADFGATSASLGAKRAIAVGDWLRRALESAQLPPERHMTKRVPDLAVNVIAGVYTRPALGGPAFAVDSLLPDAAATLYIGMREPFRGLSVAMADSINVAESVCSLTYWNGTWTTPTSLTDTTIGQNGTAAFGQGGRLAWALPDDWMPRAIDPSAPSSLAYWVRLSVSAALQPSMADQILALCRSRLTYPVACYTLALIYQEGIGNTRGDWAAKARLFEDAAKVALDLALPLIKDEFDLDLSESLIRPEANSITRDPFTWDRG